MKKLFSVLTDDLEHCFICSSSPVAIHHVFGGANRKKSEKCGFLVPLHPYWHTDSNESIHRGNKQLDLHLKQLAQSYYEENIGTREEFMKEFGKSYL